MANSAYQNFDTWYECKYVAQALEIWRLSIEAFMGWTQVWCEEKNLEQSYRPIFSGKKLSSETFMVEKQTLVEEINKLEHRTN